MIRRRKSRINPLWGRALLVVASTGFSLYLLQALLMAWANHRRFSASDAIDFQALGLPHDRRTPFELLKDGENSDRRLTLHLGPAFIVEHDGIESRGRRIFPLSGMTRRKVIFCNEYGPYVFYRSDEHGFNNPPGMYRRGLDLMLIGDSFTEGSCVEPGKDIASLLRRRYPRAVSLGQGGIAALAELALFREYARPLEPKILLWLHYGNDVGEDFSRELASPFLSQYLDPGFSQGLLKRRREIDAAWSVFLKAQRKLIEEKGTRPEPVGRLADWRHQAGLRLGQRAARFLGFYYLFFHLRDHYSLSEADERNLSLFLKLMREVHGQVRSWGGRFYFVYLPERAMFEEVRVYTDRFREPLLAGLREAGIPVLDMHEAFKSHPDPLSLFFQRKSTHYNEPGYQLVADSIARALEPRAEASPCAGPASPSGELFACPEGKNSVSLRDLGGRVLSALSVPAYPQSASSRPGEIRSLHWSPDGRKLLMASSYDGIQDIYTVYDLERKAVIYQEPGKNFLSWLADSSSFLTHNSYEGFCGEVELAGPDRYRHSVTLFRHPLKGPSVEWGRFYWSAQLPIAAGEAGVMAGVEWIKALEQGRRIRAKVEIRPGIFQVAEAQSRGRHELRFVR
ncbi:MAG: hypothetical protein HY549_06525 [Elusimicrobia bacterium]|nr:hypothetical protein [Elusimicrobiota bacterium]